MTDTTRTFTCKVCGEEKHPPHAKGQLPETCTDCKEAAKKEVYRQRVNTLREADGRPPIPPPDETPPEPQPQVLTDDEATVEDPLPVAPPEESWLDSPDAQELLRQKRQRELATGVTYDAETHGTVQDFLAADIAVEEADAVVEQGHEQALVDYSDVGEEPGPAPAAPRPATDIASPAATCIADCGSPNPPHAGLFCLNHWQQVSLEDRNILLGTAVNSEPFIDTARRAVRRLRS